jgi:hypothetical protein
MAMDELRDVLNRVASGDLEPTEAARLLGDEPASSAGPPTQTRPIERVRIRATGMKVSIVADPSVTGAIAVGPHGASENDGVLTIGAPELEDQAFHYEWPGLGGVARSMWAASRGAHRLAVRVNPTLALEIENYAGSVEIAGMRNSLVLRLGAGSLRVADCRGPVDVAVTSGSANLELLLTEGASRISCELGSVQLSVLKGSDVTISARAEQGSVKMSNGRSADRGESAEAKVGTGAAKLDIDVRLGSVKVGTP